MKSSTYFHGSALRILADKGITYFTIVAKNMVDSYL